MIRFGSPRIHPVAEMRLQRLSATQGVRKKKHRVASLHLRPTFNINDTEVEHLRMR
jgi:hypothetical protein